MRRILGYRLALLTLVICSIGGAILAPEIQSHFAPAAAPDTGEEERAMVADDGMAEDADAAPEFADEAAQSDEAGPPMIPPQIFLGLAMVVLSVGLFSTLGAGLIVSEGVRSGLLIAALAPILGALIKGEEATLTRGRMLGYVEAHPGIHFSALRDALGLANGVTSHHLHVLERDGRIISWSNGNRRRYAVSGTDPKKLETLSNPVTGMQRAILEVLAESGELGMSSSELRARLESSRQLMSYHLRRLDERELVAKSGKGRKAPWALTDAGQNLLRTQQEAAI